MIIVADTSALIALSTCGALYVLEKVFNKVVVTQTVYDECVIAGKYQSDALQKYLNNKIKTIDNPPSLTLPSNLGQGEISAMLLYKKLNADYLLIDDSRARKIAKFNNIDIIGSLGMLLIAKKHKYIKNILPLLKKLEKSDLYISAELIQGVIKLADE